MKTKSDSVRILVRNHDYKAALAIVKTFRLGITQEQSVKMVRAYECMTNARFYRSIGTDIHSTIKEGILVLIELYGEGVAA